MGRTHLALAVARAESAGVIRAANVRNVRWGTSMKRSADALFADDQRQGAPVMEFYAQGRGNSCPDAVV
jgi:hypothetical protein